MEIKYLLARYDDCYALLTNQNFKAGDFMADKNGIYQVPEIDGFIGFFKVIACTKTKGTLPLIRFGHKFFISNIIKGKEALLVEVELDDLGSPKIKNGFITLIGIKIPQ